MKTAEIKSEIKTEFEKFTPNPMMKFATEYILSQTNNDFWQEEVAPYLGCAINLIMEFATNGLLIDGTTGKRVATMAQDTGAITITHRQI